MSAMAKDLESSFSLRALESGLVPDWLIRRRIRALLAQRLREEDRGDPQAQQEHLSRFVAELRASPIAINTRDANQQHYELPTAFFAQVLGKHMKYSSCLFALDDQDAWRAPHEQLDSAAAAMLALTTQRARISDGDRILELGCGWGSLSLWLAERFPGSRITGVSNSSSQKQYIDTCAALRGLTNLEIITCDVNALELPADEFDRVVSVEMFEHMRNYEMLLARVAGWMKPQATLFVHIFTHPRFAYPFEVRDDSDWMARYFFTGGIMPSHNLLLHFQRDQELLEQWSVDGRHYQLTSEAWLANMDAARPGILPILAETYGQDAAQRWWVYWRVFFMSCAELWGFAGGGEWQVSHYLFRKKG
ncbi:MAG: class I SAM-dependent methyltransferase [Steroidobacteraceae bacterium]